MVQAEDLSSFDICVIDMHIFGIVQVPSSGTVRYGGALGDLAICERVRVFNGILGFKIVEYGRDTAIWTFDAVDGSSF